MLDGHGSDQPSIQQQLEWENVAIKSILSINNLTQPNNPTLAQIIRIRILIFDIRTIGLIDTAAASLVSSDILFQLRGKTIKSLKNDDNTPVFRTVSGQELYSLGQYEFPITINKDHTFDHSFYVMNVEFKQKANLFVLVTARWSMWLAVHSGQKGLLFIFFPYLSLSSLLF
jgi:hypothetical protein